MSHLCYFKVQNFKCFESLEIPNIGQINLIVGDNNVGKTALMEAMMVDEDPLKTLGLAYQHLGLRGSDYFVRYEDSVPVFPEKSYFSQLVKRGNTSLKVQFKLKKYSQSILNIANNDLRMKSGYAFTFTGVGDQYIKIENSIGSRVDTLKPYDSNIIGYGGKTAIPFVPARSLDTAQLNQLYNEVCGVSKKIRDDLVEMIGQFIPGLESIQTIDTGNGRKQLGIGIKGEEVFVPLSSFGFGSNRFLEIVLFLYRSENARLFIDEIEMGIHHSRLQTFLKHILTLADKLKVQLFMTTHSKECQEIFVKVLDSDHNTLKEEFREIGLYLNKKGAISGSILTFKQLQDALSWNIDTRD